VGYRSLAEKKVWPAQGNFSAEQPLHRLSSANQIAFSEDRTLEALEAVSNPHVATIELHSKAPFTIHDEY
jgi:hypothetical protein